MEKIMNKLVRDRIPEIIISNGEQPFYHILSQEEYDNALIEKMLEEYQEICHAKTNAEILEECADLMEVLFAYTVSHGYSEEDLLKARVRKREKRGGFDQRIFLEKTETNL